MDMRELVGLPLLLWRMGRGHGLSDRGANDGLSGLVLRRHTRLYSADPVAAVAAALTVTATRRGLR